MIFARTSLLFPRFVAVRRTLVRKSQPVKPFADLLEYCRSSKFLNFTIEDGLIRQLALTPVGKMLHDNVREEWKQAIASSKPGTATVPIYDAREGMSLQENLKLIREKHPNSFPFGLRLEKEKKNAKPSFGDSLSLDLDIGTELGTIYVIPPQMERQFLYQAQRQRKIWWMRLSDNPGRYFISDAKSNEQEKHTTVSIGARFADRSEQQVEVEIERLDLFTRSFGEEEVGKMYFTMPSTKKKCIPSMLRVRNDLTRATMAVLMDALEFTEPERCVNIHRKIAPFKCGIVYQTQDEKLLQDLLDLSKHLTYVLRNSQLSVLNCALQQRGVTTDASHKQQITDLDVSGVPYALVLNDEALKTGLMQLRSRDTTLSETIHISDLPHYLLKIIRS